MSYITVENLTKDYGNNRGIFNISLEINKGEALGIVGINGAGKTTLLRHLMGFLKSDKGRCTISGLDCWRDADKIKKLVSYVPGEIAFPPLPTGDAFLEVQADFWGVKDLTSIKAIAKKLQLDTTANLKRMSKGMKQKTALTASFISNNDILIYDEPTTGLDPLMRNVFLDMVQKEREKGKTVIMSSHMFNEIEDCCDRVVILKDGQIIGIINTAELHHNHEKTYKIEFVTKEDFTKFQTEKVVINSARPHYNQVFVSANDNEINEFMLTLSKYKVKFISEIKNNLEEEFMHIYQSKKELNYDNQ